MVSAGISELILVLPLIVATQPWESVLTSLGFSLLIYQTGKTVGLWELSEKMHRKCFNHLDATMQR